MIDFINKKIEKNYSELNIIEKVYKINYINLNYFIQIK